MRIAKQAWNLVVAMIVGLGLVGATGTVLAQDNQNSASGIVDNLLQSPARPATNAAPAAAPAVEQKLTYETFPAFAAQMGFETKKIGEASYQIDIVRDGWTLYTQVWIDKANNKVWLIAYLRQIPDLSQVPATAYYRLLESNCLIGPTHFYVSKNNLFMGRPFENENVTAVRFRRELDQFFSDCQKTESLWTVEKWNELANPTPPAPAAPAAPVAPSAPSAQ